MSANYQSIFIHIPKTAGSSIRTLLAQNYKSAEIVAFGGAREKFASFLKTIEARPNIKLIHGHFPFGVGRNMGKNVKEFTLLRDPIKRYFSDYFFAFIYKDHNLHEKIANGEISIEDYARLGEREPYFDNIMTKFIAGLDSGGLFRRPSDKDLDLAKKNLNNEISVFGLTERFDESILLIAREFLWDKPFYMRKNVSQRTIADVSPGVIDIVEPWVALDKQLYDFANHLFSERIEALGEEFLEVLGAMQRIEAEIHREYEAENHRQFVTSQRVDSVLRRANRRMPTAFLERLFYNKDYNMVRDFIIG